MKKIKRTDKILGAVRTLNSYGVIEEFELHKLETRFDKEYVLFKSYIQPDGDKFTAEFERYKQEKRMRDCLEKYGIGIDF